MALGGSGSDKAFLKSGTLLVRTYSPRLLRALDSTKNPSADPHNPGPAPRPVVGGRTDPVLHMCFLIGHHPPRKQMQP